MPGTERGNGGVSRPAPHGVLELNGALLQAIEPTPIRNPWACAVFVGPLPSCSGKETFRRCGLSTEPVPE
jgi:hypothetical protein